MKLIIFSVKKNIIINLKKKNTLGCNYLVNTRNVFIITHNFSKKNIITKILLQLLQYEKSTVQKDFLEFLVVLTPGVFFYERNIST